MIVCETNAVTELASFVHHDWRIIAPLRGAWIERFNKEIRQ